MLANGTVRSWKQTYITDTSVMLSFLRLLKIVVPVAALVIIYLILSAGDVEKNPGPQNVKYTDVDAVQILDEDDLTDIMEEVESLRSVYFPLGRSLRLRNEDLEAISKKYPNECDEDRALNDVLLLWLRQRYKVEKFGPPTWRMLVEAVDKKTGGNNHDLAEKIASNHAAGSAKAEALDTSEESANTENASAKAKSSDTCERSANAEVETKALVTSEENIIVSESYPLSIENTREVLNLTWNYRSRWKLIGIELGIDIGTLDAIFADNKRVEDCLTDLIKHWLRDKRFKPTRDTLTRVLQSERISSVTDGGLSYKSESESCNDYSDFLKSLYALLTPTKNTPYQWPPAATSKVFQLTMIVSKNETLKSVMQATTNFDSDASVKGRSIQLNDILSQSKYKGKRIVVLIEGPPGCGKTTLCLHTCQQWGIGKLFQEYKYVLLVQLRDPEIMSAKSVRDLLPDKNSKIAERVYDEITTSDGQGVLWIFDGWDEIYSNLSPLSHHVICKLIGTNHKWKIKLHKSHIIITSRPISSGDHELREIASSRIQILGFHPDEQQRYFSECLVGDAEAVKALVEKINTFPSLAGSCYLPLNASIITHLCKCESGSLPTTQYELLSALICNCILRHCRERISHNISFIESLDQLPDVVQEPFDSLCEVAYHGVIEDQVTFTLCPNYDTLGLLCGVGQSAIYGHGTKDKYSFIHSSIQEFLAAVHIARQMNEFEQVALFRRLFHNPRFSAIFQHFAAITKFKISGISNSITTIAQWYATSPTSLDGALLLSLLNCAFEAQDLALCQLLCKEIGNELNFSDSHTLNPMDCNTIGYFISKVCTLYSGTFKLIFNNHSITSVQGWKYMVETICKQLSSYPEVTAAVELQLACHNITAKIVQELLDPDPRKIQEVSQEDITDGEVESNEMLLHLSTLLEETVVVSKLNLALFGFTSDGCKNLSDALMRNTSLKVLHISMNRIYDKGIQQLVQFLEVNRTLKELSLQACGITNNGLKYLIESLLMNDSLEVLNISGNPGITHEGISAIEDFLCDSDCTALSKIYVSEDIEFLAPLITAREFIDNIRMLKSLHKVDFIADESVRFLSSTERQEKQVPVLDSNSAGGDLEILTEIFLKSQYSLLNTCFQQASICGAHFPSYSRDEYVQYLKTVYLDFKLPPSCDQHPLSGSEELQVFQLAKLKVSKKSAGEAYDSFTNKTITGKLDDILENKEPVELKDIFKGVESGQKIILLLGAHGSGKTTLSLYICQQWALQNLFSEYKLVILIQLQDPSVLKATTLADLIPSRDDYTASRVADEIEATQGQDVLWILDGWDKLPHEMRNNSFLYMLVTANVSPIANSAVIVTSRPSCPDKLGISYKLHPLYEAQVELLGLSSEQLQNHFLHCLDGDSRKTETLLKEIEDNVVFSAICSAPLYANILAYIFKCQPHEFPSNEYDLILSLVLHRISAFLNDGTQVCSSLESIPEALKEPFYSLCELAYEGFMKERTAFHLPIGFQTLGLLQSTNCFTRPQSDLSYHFLHLSVQYLLAAQYIATQIELTEQAAKIKEIFDAPCLESHHVSVLQFYATVTRLEVPRISPVLKQVAERCSTHRQDDGDVKLLSKEEKELLLALISCLHGARDSLLCQLVSNTLRYKLELSRIFLFPSRLLSIAFFVYSIFSKDVIDIDFGSCSIRKEGCQLFLSEISKHQSEEEMSNIKLNLSLQKLELDSFVSLIMTGSDSEYMHEYTFQSPHNPTFGDQISPLFTKYLEYQPCALCSLNFSGNGLTSRGAWYLSKALSHNMSLIELDLNYSLLGEDGIQSIAEALKQNDHLQVLYMQGCRITDRGLVYFCQALSVNKALKVLDISNNGRITSNGFSVVADCLSTLKNSTLEVLRVPIHLESEVIIVCSSVNEVRNKNKLPVISMEGISFTIILYY